MDIWRETRDLFCFKLFWAHSKLLYNIFHICDSAIDDENETPKKLFYWSQDIHTLQNNERREAARATRLVRKAFQLSFLFHILPDLFFLPQSSRIFMVIDALAVSFKCPKKCATTNMISRESRKFCMRERERDSDHFECAADSTTWEIFLSTRHFRLSSLIPVWPNSTKSSFSLLFLVICECYFCFFCGDHWQWKWTRHEIANIIFSRLKKRFYHSRPKLHNNFILW